MKPWIKTLIVSLIQIVTYLIICEIALHIRHHFLTTKPDLEWGLLYRYSFCLFCVLVFFGNSISTFFFQGSRKSVSMVMNAWLMIMSIQLLYNYHFPTALYAFMYPDWVLWTCIVI